MPTSTSKIYCIFHLNLAFSSIDKSAHPQVIEHCYWPLLNIIEKESLPMGLEMTAYTLECIENIDAAWVKKLKQLMQQGLIELVASGDSQIIGPLIPAELNTKNLQLGQQYYEALLDVRPTVAYINEQAVSTGILDIYLDNGFEAVVVEWDNPYSHNPDWPADAFNQPQTLLSASGRPIKVIWNHAIAFQKFQRFAHGELVLDDYLEYLYNNIKGECRSFCIYGSDAEVFDYRPGRYTIETVQATGEWQRIRELFVALKNNDKYCWVKPKETLKYWRQSEGLNLGTCEHPVSVKKQAKYNITRWALSGRNDLALNTLCFRRLREILDNPDSSDTTWRELCRLWASDLRTHLCESRYQEIRATLPAPTSLTIQSSASANTDSLPIHSFGNYQIHFDQQRNKLDIQSAGLKIRLNANRGLCIEYLAFSEHGFQPVIGTLTHGHFDHIGYGADFFSNHFVMERFRQRDRITDLSKVRFSLHEEKSGDLFIRTEIPTSLGALMKTYRLTQNTLECGFELEQKERPESSLRLGFITLLDCDNRPWFSCHNGGTTEEFFLAKEDFDHGKPASSIVSASSALGATTGCVNFGTGDRGIKLSWNPHDCAALPMISSKHIRGAYLNRLWFSLVEADETLKPEGLLPPFSFKIEPTVQPKPPGGEK